MEKEFIEIENENLVECLNNLANLKDEYEREIFEKDIIDKIITKIILSLEEDIDLLEQTLGDATIASQYVLKISNSLENKKEQLEDLKNIKIK